MYNKFNTDIHGEMPSTRRLDLPLRRGSAALD